jgi:hypothetical protein
VAKTENASDKSNPTADNSNRIPPQSNSATAPSERKAAERYNESALENRERFIYQPFKCFVWRPFKWFVDLLDDHSGAIMAIATAVIMGLTISLSIDSNRQASTANEQFRIMKGQLAAMQADERPWLRVEVTPGDLLTFGTSAVEPFPDLMFGPHVKITNVGKSPAFNAQLVLLGYAITPNHSDPYAGQKEACDRERSTPLDNPARGHVLFPGDFFDEGAGIGKYIVGFMGPTNVNFFTKEKDGSLSIVFYVIGCADYAFGDPPNHHQTGFVYEVYRMTSTSGQPTFDNRFTVGQTIDPGRIKLVPGPSSSLAD